MSQSTLQEDQWIAIHDHNDNEGLRLGQEAQSMRAGQGQELQCQSEAHAMGWDKGLILNIDPKQRIQKSPITGPTTPHSSQIVGYTAEKNQS